MVEKILNNTTPYGKIMASHEGSLHSSTLSCILYIPLYWTFPVYLVYRHDDVYALQQNYYYIYN